MNSRALHLLDAGAGVGALTAAVVDRIIALRAAGALPKLEEITLEAWELDQDFIPSLRKNLGACVAGLERIDIQVRLALH